MTAIDSSRVKAAIWYAGQQSGVFPLASTEPTRRKPESAATKTGHMTASILLDGALRRPDPGTIAHGHRLATPIEVERTWTPDREAMLAALRVVLGLPRLRGRTA